MKKHLIYFTSAAILFASIAIIMANDFQWWQVSKTAWRAAEIGLCAGGGVCCVMRGKQKSVQPFREMLNK